MSASCFVSVEAEIPLPAHQGGTAPMAVVRSHFAVARMQSVGQMWRQLLRCLARVESRLWPKPWSTEQLRRTPPSPISCTFNYRPSGWRQDNAATGWMRCLPRGRSLYRLTRAVCEGQKHDLEFNSPHDHGRCPDHRRYRLCELALSTDRSQQTTVGPENRPSVDRVRTVGRLSVLFC